MKEKQQNKYTKAVILILNSSKSTEKLLLNMLTPNDLKKEREKKKNETMNEQTKQKNI